MIEVPSALMRGSRTRAWVIEGLLELHLPYHLYKDTIMKSKNKQRAIQEHKICTRKSSYPEADENYDQIFCNEYFKSLMQQSFQGIESTNGIKDKI